MRSTIPRTIVGINGHHDTSACLIHNGAFLSAVEGERLLRVKHATTRNLDQLIAYCTSAAAVDDIGQIGLCANSANRRQQEWLIEVGIPTISHHLAHAYSAVAMSGMTDMAIMVLDGSGNRVTTVEPEHRGNAVLPEEAEEAESYYLVTGPTRHLEVVKKRWGVRDPDNEPRYHRFPSLGHMYATASEYIFGHWTDAGKVMALAPYGSPQSLMGLTLLHRESGELTVSTRWIDQLPQEFRRGAGWGKPAAERIYRDLAWRVQSELEQAVMEEARWLHRETGIDRLCIVGGVALNCSVNARVAAYGPFPKVLVPWAPGDSGVAIGCAYHAARESLKGSGRVTIGPYAGRRYRSEEIQQLLDSYAAGHLLVSSEGPTPGCTMTLRYGADELSLECSKLEVDIATGRYSARLPFRMHMALTWQFQMRPSDGDASSGDGRFVVDQARRSLTPIPIVYERLDDPSGRVAELLAADAVVGWYVGRAEFGPRALGNRSILASPRTAEMVDRVNRIKGREAFRPVAPVVPLEDAERFFSARTSSPYMTMAATVRPERRHEIPATVHLDGSARVQTVASSQNEPLYELLRAFERATGVPVLINTSFNDHTEPIVETPLDALRTFISTGLDALVMENWVVTPMRR